jgi:hypothetical protein
MSPKKAILILLSLCLLIGIVFWSYRYYLLNKTSHLAEHIPADAQTIVYLNTRVVYQNFPKSGQGDLNFLKNNPYFKHIKNPLTVGIDFTSDAAYVELENTRYVLVLISDLENFENTIKTIGPDIFTQAVKSKAYSSVISRNDSFQLVWNEKALAIVPKQFANKGLEQIFKSELNFGSSNIFNQVKDDSAAFWFYAKKSSLEPIKGKTLKGIGYISKGLEIFASESLSSKITKDIPLIKSDSNYSIFSADKNETYINKYLKDLCILLLGPSDDNIMTVDFDRADKSLLIGGNKRVENKSITYAYDENFNKTQVVKSSYDTIKMAKLSAMYFNQKEVTNFRNCNEIDSISWPIIPFDYSAYLNFNQLAMGQYLKSPLQYHVEFIHFKNNKNIDYYLKIKSSNWKTILKSKLF